MRDQAEPFLLEQIKKLEEERDIEAANGKHWADLYSKWCDTDLAAVRLKDAIGRAEAAERQFAEAREQTISEVIDLIERHFGFGHDDLKAKIRLLAHVATERKS